jgi:mannose-1-phosphate guanylyltransferase
MNAILLAAGLGTRLKPITNKVPKCLVLIKGKPLLEYWLDNLYKIGVKKILINTHYKSEQVVQYIENSKYKRIIEIKYEKDLRGTAGTFIDNINFYNENDGLLIHADNYSEDDLVDFIKTFNLRPSESLITMMTFNTLDPKNCGIVKTNSKKIVTEYYEKEHENHGNLANAAIYIISKKAQKEISQNHKDKFDFSKDIIPNFINRINTYHTNKLLIDIGTIENYNKVNNVQVKN